MVTLVKLSESDKRLIFALILIFIFVFVLIAGIGYLIKKFTVHQGKKLDKHVFDVVKLRVITEPKHFVSYANKKNLRLFYYSSRIPLIIIMAVSLTLVIRNLICNNWTNPFSVETGFCSLFFIWDFSDPSCYGEFFGLTILSKWPPLTNTPNFYFEYWANYLFCFGVIIAGVWYLLSVAAFIGRFFRIHTLKKTIFDKDLTGFNQNKEQYDAINKNIPQHDEV